jgi:hypothetical protein
MVPFRHFLDFVVGSALLCQIKSLVVASEKHLDDQCHNWLATIVKRYRVGDDEGASSTP